MAGRIFALAWFALVFVGAGTVMAQAPGSGIAGTAHDFTGFAAPAALCEYCHTPHRALQTLLIWNHELSTNTFQWDVPKTTAGTEFPTMEGDTYKGPTTKCLSCHDGSVAIDSFGGGSGGMFMNPGAQVGAGGDLSFNHPVAMPFPFGNLASVYNGKTNGPGLVLDDWQADPDTLNIRLFNDDGSGNITAGAVSTKTGVECSSCHDPHNRRSVESYFLRGSMSGTDTDYICLKCHIK